MRSHGLPVERINKVLQGRPHCVDAIKSGDIQLVFNTVAGVINQSSASAMPGTERSIASTRLVF